MHCVVRKISNAHQNAINQQTLNTTTTPDETSRSLAEKNPLHLAKMYSDHFSLLDYHRSTIKDDKPDVAAVSMFWHAVFHISSSFTWQLTFAWPILDYLAMKVTLSMSRSIQTPMRSCFSLTRSLQTAMNVQMTTLTCYRPG